MKQHAPAAERNKQPILNVLDPVLPTGARVLELASGTGQHAAFICSQRPDLIWQPSDINPEALGSIEAWRQSAPSPNLQPPIELDISAPTLPPIANQPWQAIVAINLIHISPWAVTVAIMEHSSQRLAAGGLLYFYGPFFRPNETPAPSNLAFDQSLRERDAAWGIRQLDEVQQVAERTGLILENIVPMPANNFSVLFRNQT
jgi:hypothetical protein